MQLRPEEEAVLLCSRAVRSAAQERRLCRLLGAFGDDWQRFWDEAAEQQVNPLVARTLTSQPWASALPSAVVQTARSIRLRTMAHNIALHGELARIGEQLRASGVSPVPLKGTHLAERLYGSLDARQTGDIDVLVRGSDFRAAQDVLQAMGYAPVGEVTPGIEEHTFHGVPLMRQVPSGSFVIELHWMLNNPRFVTIDYEALWQRIEANSRSQAQLRLPNEEQLLFLALHLPKHDLGMLRLVADIDRLVRGESETLDWSYTLTLAECWHVTGPLYFSLRWAHQLLGTPLPGGTMPRLAPAAWKRVGVEVLAGPYAMLRPPTIKHMRTNRFRLAYCGMLSPFSRSVAAYSNYLCPQLGSQPRSLPQVVGGTVRRVAHGIAWTGIVVVTSLVDRWRDGAYDERRVADEASSDDVIPEHRTLADARPHSSNGRPDPVTVSAKGPAKTTGSDDEVRNADGLQS